MSRKKDNQFGLILSNLSLIQRKYRQFFENVRMNLVHAMVCWQKGQEPENVERPRMQPAIRSSAMSILHKLLSSDDTKFISVNGSRLIAINRSEVGTNG